nr:uncharacterized protein LOC123497772 [Aegilops tauschii subsp. strangulata]
MLWRVGAQDPARFIVLFVLRPDASEQAPGRAIAGVRLPCCRLPLRLWELTINSEKNEEASPRPPLGWTIGGSRLGGCQSCAIRSPATGGATVDGCTAATDEQSILSNSSLIREEKGR